MILDGRQAIYFRAIGAGVVAAAAGGVAWALIVKWSDYEIGVVAWAIGFLVSMAILLGAGQRRGLPFQLVAIVLSLLGILLGKYLSYVWTLQDFVAEQTDGAVDIPLVSRDTFADFKDDLDFVFNWIDLLWAGLAIFTAWRTLAPRAPEPEPEPEPDPTPS